MKTAIRKHLRDFVAILGLLVLAGAVSSYILTNQRLTLPGWVPVIGKDFYEFKGEFSTGQAVTPGQGQTVNVAGVKVGEISRVELEGGKAILGMRLDSKDVVVREDASLLLRPKTGLKDMTVELNPGTDGSPRLKENGVIPVAQTQPDVNLDEFLAALDDDTRTYLSVLVGAAGEGLQGRGEDLGETFKTFKPTADALERLNGELKTRSNYIRRAMNNFSLVAEELGNRDDDLAKFVDAQNAVLTTLANQGTSIRATLRNLPGALTETRSALGKATTLAEQLGPTLEDLRPAARALGPTQRQVRPFLRETTPVIRDSVRPLVRETRPLVTELRPTLRDLSKAVPDTYVALRVVNQLVNMLAYNPPGDEEGYLFWLSWANHLGASVFTSQDAHGPIRRGLLLVGCESLAILDNVAAVNPALGTTIGLINVVRTSAVCPQQQGLGK